MDTKKELFFLGLVAVLLMVPFVSKPFHVDSHYFIYTARQIIEDPLHPYSYSIISSNRLLEDAFEITDPLLMIYYYAAIILFFGTSEIVLHLSILPFSIGCLFVMYFLSLRLIKEGFLPSVLLLTTPAFLVSASTIMLDVPFLFFFLGSILFSIYYHDTANWRWMFFSSLFVSFALMTKYTGIILFPLLIIYHVLKKKRIEASLLWFLFPLGVFFLWSFYTFFIYDNIHFFNVFHFQTKGFSLFKFIVQGVATLSFFSGFLLFPFVLLFVRIKRSVQFVFLSFFVSFITSVFVRVKLGYSCFSLFLLFIFVFAGFFFIVEVIYFFFEKVKKSLVDIKSFFKLADDLLLFFWFFGILVFNLIILFTAARYLLILAPVAIILFFRIMQQTKIVKKTIVVMVLIIAFFSILLSIVDYQHANAYKSFSNTAEKDYDAFVGAWGFLYYMTEKGYSHYNPLNDSLEKGTKIVLAFQTSPFYVFPEGLNIEKVDTIQHHSALPIKIFNYGYAGFYSHGWGLLPFTFSYEPIEEFRVYEVR